MKFNVAKFDKAMRSMRDFTQTSYEKNFELDIVLQEGDLHSGNVVDCMILVVTSTRPSDTYNPDKSITRTLEVFGANENQDSLLTTVMKETIKA